MAAARVEEREAGEALAVLEEEGVELLDHRVRALPRAALDALDAPHEAADLVLPAPPGGEHLLDLENLPDELVEHHRPAEEAGEPCGKDVGRG